MLPLLYVVVLCQGDLSRTGENDTNDTIATETMVLSKDRKRLSVAPTMPRPIAFGTAIFETRSITNGV